MKEKIDISLISDQSKPNAGRVYDYFLGGNYNFEIDRKYGDEVIKKIPFVKKSARLIRWFLGKTIDTAFKEGFTFFLDFASGLPNVDHIHTRIPDNLKDKVKIIYSDIDPVTVHLGNEIIGDNPLVKYLECDCRITEKLLNSDVVKSFFGENHKVVIGLNGVIWFLSDKELKNTMNILYDWASEGTILYFTDFDSENLKDDDNFKAFLKLYKNMNQPIFTRAKKQLMELIKPWKVREPGLLLLEEWNKYFKTITEESKKLLGGNTYGGILKK